MPLSPLRGEIPEGSEEFLFSHPPHRLRHLSPEGRGMEGAKLGRTNVPGFYNRQICSAHPEVRVPVFSLYHWPSLYNFDILQRFPHKG